MAKRLLCMLFKVLIENWLLLLKTSNSTSLQISSDKKLFCTSTCTHFFPDLQAYYNCVCFVSQDMNEPSNMVEGSTTGCPDNSLENPPWVPPGVTWPFCFYIHLTGVIKCIMGSTTALERVCSKVWVSFSSHRIFFIWAKKKKRFGLP